MTRKGKSHKKNDYLSKNNNNSDTISTTLRFDDDQNDLKLERHSTELSNDFACLGFLNPLDFKDEIDRCIAPVAKALSQCQPCECFHFREDVKKNETEALSAGRDLYECSSEASSAFVSLIDLEEDECENMVKAANINEFRKQNILSLPFKDEYLTVKSIKKKVSSKESESSYSSALRPKEDVDTRFARPAWITGLHDTIGLGAYEWEKMIKSILGQGKYGRKSSREPFFRFQLPYNLELLKDLTPKAFLENYCFISDRRMALYQKEFGKHREPKGIYVTENNLFKALDNIMVGTLTKEQFNFIHEILELTPGMKMEISFFSTICALTERLFFNKNLTSSSEESFEIQKGYIEMADFMNINCKLRGVSVSSNLEKLIRSI